MSTISEIREERRKDQAAKAEQRRADAAVEREQRRQDEREARQRRDQRSEARRARITRAVGWVAARPVELLMSLIIVVPGVLAWSAMAAYGAEVYGPVGWILPAFTEGGMWAFAFAAHAARRDEKPVGWLVTGVWVFTAVAAAMNYTHGVEVSAAHGLVMAVVAIGGVVAHQLITAAPMRTRRSVVERRAVRTARVAARRATAMERRAVRQAAGEVAGDGSVALVYRPGTVTLTRTRVGGRRLVPTTVPGQPVRPVEDAFDTELAALLDSAPEPGGHPAGTAKTPPTGSAESAGDGVAGTVEEDAAELAGEVAAVRRAIAAGELPERPSRRKVQAVLGCRAETAQRVVRAVRDGDDGDATEGVAA